MKVTRLSSRTLERAGQGAYAEYRIPGIAVTEKGTLLIVYEGRMSSNDDWAKIDAVLLRSTDSGGTFTRRVIASPGELGGAEGDTVNNPVLIVDGSEVHIVFHLNYTRAFVIHSGDDGETWSTPAEITDTFRSFPCEWNVCASGPGHGIRMRTGRLVVPVWLANGARIDARRAAHQPSAAGWILSDDGGRTWQCGRMFAGVKNANETNVCETENGTLLFNIRNTESDLHRRIAYSQDGRTDVSEVRACDTLLDPICFGSTVSIGGSVLFSGCDNGLEICPEAPRARVDLMLKLSSDCGRTWQRLTLVERRGGYSDVCVSGNKLFVLYETTDTVTGVITEMRLVKCEMT